VEHYDSGRSIGNHWTAAALAFIEGAWLPCAIAGMANLAVLAAIVICNPEYLRNYRLNLLSDAHHYVVLGDNIVLRGEFSRCSKPPYVADSLRTPVYPVVVGALHQMAGPAGIYLFHALCQVAACAVLYRLVSELFGPRPAFWAALALAFDLMLAMSNFEVMSEPLYLVLNLAGMALLLPPLVDPAKASLRRAVGGGILLGMATLVRPAGLYVPVVVMLVAGGAAAFSPARRIMLRNSLAALITSSLPVALWIARNWHVFSLPRLTTADAIMLVYFFAAGGYQVEQGCTLEEAQQQISAEYRLPPPEITNNHWQTSESVRSMDDKLRRAFWPLVSRHPLSIAESSVRGIAKSTISHNVANYGHYTDREWTPPGLSAALAGDSAALSRLTENPADMIFLLVAQLGHTALVWPLAIVGVIVGMIHRPTRGAVLAVGLVLSYFLVTQAIVGMEAYWRSRSPHMPLVYVFAGLAAASFVGWLQRRASWSLRSEVRT
jgi:4-amino-4-deoxy-L-arabinose transferase-like glycosyltransferase